MISFPSVEIDMAGVLARKVRSRTRTLAPSGIETKASGSYKWYGTPHSPKWRIRISNACRSSGDPDERTSEENLSTTDQGTSSEISSSTSRSID